MKVDKRHVCDICSMGMCKRKKSYIYQSADMVVSPGGPSYEHDRLYSARTVLTVSLDQSNIGLKESVFDLCDMCALDQIEVVARELRAILRKP